MKQKNVLILTGLTVAAVAVAAISLREHEDTRAEASSTLLFPGLEARVNDVARIVVAKGDKTVTVEREGGTWKLSDHGGYPAKFDPVKQMVVRLSQLEIEEKKTARKDNHQKLGVEWPVTAEEGSDAAEAAHVTLSDSTGQPLADLIVGKSEWRGSKPKIYVRRANEDQVYLCSTGSSSSLDVVPDAKQWIEPKFLELDKERVQDVTITHADGEVVEIARSATNHTRFAVQNAPPGEVERYEGIADGVATALSSGLTLEDVRPAAEVDMTQQPLAHTRYRTYDGLELVLELAKQDDQTWARVQASYVAPPKPVGPAPDAAAGKAAGEADGKEAAEATGDDVPPEGETPPEEPKRDVAAEVRELNERLGPWAFAVTSYRVDQLARHMKDLLAEPSPVEDSLAPEGTPERLMQDFGDQGESDALEPEAPKDDEEQAEAPPAPETPR